ncbi:MAG: extracellular solute-binding protein [Clostridiales bacterium]|nr:extracellular solute-binding protein [Clostridiales bacterium]
MKRIVICLTVIMLVFCLAACNGADNEGIPGYVKPVGPDGTSDNNISGEITVSAYETLTQKAFLEEAASLFEEKYPGTKVNIETFSAMPEIRTAETSGGRMSAIQMQDDPIARADYISKVSNSLMSGTGADILAVDVLPLYKYVDNNQLVDLKTLIAKDRDFFLSEYRSNIINALNYNYSLWYMPLEYSFEYYTFDSTLINRRAADFGNSSSYDTQKLIEIASRAFDGSAKIFNMASYSRAGVAGGIGMPSGLFARMLQEQYSSLVDVENKEAHFTDGGFADLLNSVKEYEKLGYVSEGVSAQADPERLMSGQGGPPQPTERFFFKPKNNMTLQQHFNRDSGRRMNVMMYSVGSAIGIEDDDEIAGAQANALGQVPFTFQYGYAINADSKNQETAWAFIKFLLSEEIQLSTSMNAMSLPINNAARRKKAEMLISGAFMGMGMRRGQEGQVQGQAQDQSPDQTEDLELDEAQKEVLAKYIVASEQLSDLINTYTIRDNVIDDMIAAEVQYFFDGTKSADEVAEALQGKVELYLNE